MELGLAPRALLIEGWRGEVQRSGQLLSGVADLHGAFETRPAGDCSKFKQGTRDGVLEKRRIQRSPSCSSSVALATPLDPPVCACRLWVPSGQIDTGRASRKIIFPPAPAIVDLASSFPTATHCSGVQPE